MPGMRHGLRISTATCVMLLCGPAAAHHSVGGQFDVSRTTTLVGTVVRIDWRNPHPYIVLDVKEPSGTVQWELSTHPPAMLLEIGITRGLLAGKPGEIVTAIVHPALSGRRSGWVRRVTYSDGRFLALFEP
jgi:hypothetical protein